MTAIPTEEVLSTIVHCIADAVLVADPSGRILLANRAARALFSGAGNDAAEDLRVCHSAATWDRMLARLADPSPRESHPVLKIGDRSFEATWGRVSLPDGSLYGAVMVARDVTERLHEQQHREQRERMATIGKLAAALAHELNNPLGSIALYAQHARKGAEPGGALHEHLGTVLRNASLCKRIVRDLLEYARQRPPAMCRIDLRDVVGHAARTLQPQADRAGVRLVVQLAADVPAVVYADADQLGQVLVNLGLNAIEALAPDERAAPGAEVVIDFRMEGTDTLVFSVADNGPGITAAQRETVFAPFFTTKAEGTGLGLSVASDLVAAHGGRITLTSEPGRGATFTVSIPIAAEGDGGGS